MFFIRRVESAEFKPIQFYWDATIRSTGIKIQAQVIWFGPDNHGIAFSYFIAYHFPCPLPDSLRIVADVHSRAYLQKKPR